MFRTIWSKTLRDLRIPLLSWGCGLGFLLFITYGTLNAIATQSATSITQLYQSFSFIGAPIALNTGAGFVTWRLFDLFVPVALGVWAVLAGTNLIRREEERMSAELLLATSLSRARIFVEKLLALCSALLAIGLLIGLGIILGQKSAGGQVETLRALLTGLNISLFCFFFAALAVLLTQLFATHGTAQGWTFVILALSVMLDGTARTVTQFGWLRYLSPSYYYGINKPLITTYDAHPGAALTLLGIALLMSILGGWFFVQRDLGAGLIHLPAMSMRRQANNRNYALAKAQHDLFLRSLGLRTLNGLAIATTSWVVSILLYVIWIVSITPDYLKTIRGLVSKNPTLAQLFSGKDVATNAGFIGYSVFAFVPLLLVIFSFTLALQWAKNLDTGRMELIMSTPQTRLRLLFEHSLTIFGITVLSALLVWLTTIWSASIFNVRLDIGNSAAASFGILPMELIIVSVVYACAARLRANIILSIIALYLALAYLLEFLNPFIQLPTWLIALSIFHTYNNPMINGWQWRADLILLAITLLFFLAGIVQFGRADIDRGN